MFRVVTAAFVGVGFAGISSAVTAVHCRSKSAAEIINAKGEAAETAAIAAEENMNGSDDSSPSSALDSKAPTLNSPDRKERVEETNPVRCVIVGGGYAGARAAYQLDSIFNLTLIDSKNFFEAKEELAPLLCTPWDEETSAARLKNIHALHRYYLKRANIVTGMVIDCDDKVVRLSDGRIVPYDVLILAPGEKRPFPWGSTAKTAGIRAEELKQFNSFIKDECKKIAVVGGGPTGCVVAVELANNYPDKRIDLFHNSSTLMPSLPSASRRRALEIVNDTQGVQLRRNCTVTDIKQHISSGRVISNLPDTDSLSNNLVLAASDPTAAQPSWWTRIFSRKTPPLDDEMYHKYARNGDITGRVVFDLTVEESDSTEIETPSVLRQLYYGPVDRMKRPPKGEVLDTFTEEGYDYVFNCTGSVPNTDLFGGSTLLAPHLDWQQRVNVSRFMQLLGHPNIFCIGRCNNFPWVRGVGNSDFQARTLFRNLLTIVSNSRTKNLLGDTGSAISGHRMTFPRLIVPLGPNDAVGSTAWTGSCDGATALKEHHQDRAYFYKEFASPMFFKVHDVSTVRQAFDTWIGAASTDVADFIE